MFLNRYFSYQLNCYKSRLSLIAHVLKLLIVLTVSITNSAAAKSIDEYCISKVSQQEQLQETQKDSIDKIPPFISSVDNLPELYNNPCRAIDRYFDNCVLNEYFAYSPTLKLAFVNGYQQTNWGKNFAHLEINSKGTQSVPDLLVHSDFMEDVPALNGAIFKTDEGEALFYDGDKVINISSYFPGQKGRKKNRHYKWQLQKTYDGRIFILDSAFRSKNPPFIMEIKPGLNFAFIPISEKFKDTYLELFTLPNDSRIWGITTNGLLAEIDGKLQYVAYIQPPFIINGVKQTMYSRPNTIALEIYNFDNSFKTNYFLKHTLSTANCEVILNNNQPETIKN